MAYQYKYGAERLERVYRLMHLAASGMRCVLCSCTYQTISSICSHAIQQQVKDVDACSQSTKKVHKDLCGQLIDQTRRLTTIIVICCYVCVVIV